MPFRQLNVAHFAPLTNKDSDGFVTTADQTLAHGWVMLFPDCLVRPVPATVMQLFLNNHHKQIPESAAVHVCTLLDVFALLHMFHIGRMNNLVPE